MSRYQVRWFKSHSQYVFARFSIFRKRLKFQSPKMESPLSKTFLWHILELLYKLHITMEVNCLPILRSTSSDTDKKLCFARWDFPKLHRFNVDICEMTRTTRVVLSVIGICRTIRKTWERKLLETGINVLRVDGLLVQGPLYVRMLHSWAQGPVPHCAASSDPIICVEFTCFGCPIRIDWIYDENPSLSSTTDRLARLDVSVQGDSCLAQRRKIIVEDPLYQFNSQQKSQLRMYRKVLIDMFPALPRVLSSAQWNDLGEIEEALKSLFPHWVEPDHPAAYTE
ncbi:Phosphatidylinositol 3 and 4-kinase [Phytophthora megakarya]|uniref:Phosphatidylinositol 3 and 4-kinase n=1 Tax=Phytophthora megakarya TaxID=4795 RepID=A0A225VUC0_9STRA|nr:Phosphatidylinositol 3 and 4-kinase [Phytophthora megakarya]